MSAVVSSVAMFSLTGLPITEGSTRWAPAQWVVAPRTKTLSRWNSP